MGDMVTDGIRKCTQYGLRGQATMLAFFHAACSPHRRNPPIGPQAILPVKYDEACSQTRNGVDKDGRC